MMKANPKGSESKPTFGANNPLALRVVIAALCGIVFGVAIEKGRVFEPQVIVAQMRLQTTSMFKMFLAAAGSSQLALGLLSLIPFFHPTIAEIRAYNKGALKGRGLLAVVIGASALGVGMALAGACPGTVLVQLGSGVSSAVWVYVGGLLGALLYAFCEPFVKNAILPVGDPGEDKKLLTDLLGVRYCAIALPFGIASWSVVAIMEYFFPWTTDSVSAVSAQLEGATFPSLQAPAWPPYLAGAIIGLLQVPLSLGVGKTLGSATSYSVCVHNACYMVAPKLASKSQYIMGLKDGFQSLWQVLYVGCAVIGGFISSYASGTWGSGLPLPSPAAFLGGVLLIFGSRLAGGCTSGHGISGMTMGSLWGMTAAACMFAAGIATALLM